MSCQKLPVERKEPARGRAAEGPAQSPPLIKPDFKIIALVVLFSAATFFVLYNYGNLAPKPAPTATPNPLRGSILVGAFFYKGPRSEPRMVSYYDKEGNNQSVEAFPGQVVIRAPANASKKDVEKTLAKMPSKSKMLSAIPAIGSYMVEVPKGQEAFFITTLRILDSQYFAIPNVLLSADAESTGTKTVDFTDDGIPVCGELLYEIAFLGSPDPSAKVVTALIDNFKRDPKKPNEPSHGENTEAALRSTCGGCPLLKIGLENKMSWNDVERAVAAAVAGAEINCQDVVISLSIGPRTIFNADNLQEYEDYKNAAIRNDKAGRIWEDFMKMLLNVLANSKWASDGHVRLHKSAGNGALLCESPRTWQGETWCDRSERIWNIIGVDLEKPMNRLWAHPVYGNIMEKYVKVWCAYEDGTTKRADYSNYGPGIECKDPYEKLEGTSFCAPLGAGENYKKIRDRLASEPKKTCEMPSPQPTCSAELPTTIPVITPTVTIIPTEPCSTDAQCVSTYAAKYCTAGDSECLTKSTYWRCGQDKACHMCLYHRAISIEGKEGELLGCMTCQEGIDAGLSGDGCPEGFYCERDVCVLQSGTTVLTG